jgi:hypothetical protein
MNLKYILLLVAAMIGESEAAKGYRISCCKSYNNCANRNTDKPDRAAKCAPRVAKRPRCVSQDFNACEL